MVSYMETSDVVKPMVEYITVCLLQIRLLDNYRLEETAALEPERDVIKITEEIFRTYHYMRMSQF